MGNNHVFKDVISDYEVARPGYPIELFNDIVNFSILKKDAKILEIGSGPKTYIISDYQKYKPIICLINRFLRYTGGMMNTLRNDT